MENLGRTARALESIMPKIEGLIDSDEAYINLSNKLNMDQYHSTRRSPGYVCSPLLSIFKKEGIPHKLQNNLLELMNNEENDILTGLIPEINLAYIIVGNVFHYWTLGQRKSRPLKVELDSEINSVGLVKPQKGFFKSIRCDHILMFASDHHLIGYEISFTREINRKVTVEINQPLMSVS